MFFINIICVLLLFYFCHFNMIIMCNGTKQNKSKCQKHRQKSRSRGMKNYKKQKTEKKKTVAIILQ